MGATGDETLLQQFLEGSLDDELIEELERRLDEEPELQRQLGKLARQRQQRELDTGPVDMTARVVGRGMKRRPPDSSRLSSGIEVGPVIGEGGMAVVHLGRQHSLDRDVAVKTVRAETSASTSLLEEAWVTGQLEHPNIVPIHDIAHGDGGRVQVVLKHIEGVSWRELIEDPDEVESRFVVDDPLEWHLRVLVQVCQALRFAHSRHIVHRDVKPANVMIGRFDEVYLLDWGLAMSTEPSDRLPTRDTSFGIAGSPAYMAPEQFDPLPTEVGPRTDIYLLGATLYELICGMPPHAGMSIEEILASHDATRELPLPEHAPPELARILRRAMALEPAERFETVQEFREALESFLQHRGSEDLGRRAEDRASAMRELHALRDDDGAERAFVEASYGYRMALEQWPGNTHAHAGLHALVGQRVDQLLKLRAPGSARSALALLESPDPDLVSRVDEAVAAEVSERQTLDRLVRDEDRRVGHRTRRYFVLGFGLTWALVWTLFGVAPPASTTPLIIATVALFMPNVVAVLYFRREMLQVRLNRYITLLLCAMFATQLLWLLGATAMALPMPVVLMTLPLIWFMTIASAVPTVELRVLPAAIAYAAAFIACALRPQLLPWAFGLSNIAIFINTLAINMAIARRDVRTDEEHTPRREKVG